MGPVQKNISPLQPRPKEIRVRFFCLTAKISSGQKPMELIMHYWSHPLDLDVRLLGESWLRYFFTWLRIGSLSISIIRLA